MNLCSSKGKHSCKWWVRIRSINYVSIVGITIDFSVPLFLTSCRIIIVVNMGDNSCILDCNRINPLTI